MRWGPPLEPLPTQRKSLQGARASGWRRGSLGSDVLPTAGTISKIATRTHELVAAIPGFGLGRSDELRNGAPPRGGSFRDASRSRKDRRYVLPRTLSPGRLLGESRSRPLEHLSAYLAL